MWIFFFMNTDLPPFQCKRHIWSLFTRFVRRLEVLPKTWCVPSLRYCTVRAQLRSSDCDVDEFSHTDWKRLVMTTIHSWRSTSHKVRGGQTVLHHNRQLLWHWPERCRSQRPLSFLWQTCSRRAAAARQSRGPRAGQSCGGLLPGQWRRLICLCHNNIHLSNLLIH